MYCNGAFIRIAKMTFTERIKSGHCKYWNVFEWCVLLLDLIEYVPYCETLLSMCLFVRTHWVLCLIVRPHWVMCLIVRPHWVLCLIVRHHWVMCLIRDTGTSLSVVSYWRHWDLFEWCVLSKILRPLLTWTFNDVIQNFNIFWPQ